MKNISELSFSDIKSVYDFLEIRKGIISDNPEHFEKDKIHKVIMQQKIIWTELQSRVDNIEELKV